MAKKSTGKARGAAAGPPDLSHLAEGLRPLAFAMADIVPDAANARLHDDANISAIMGSLRQFGQTSPLIVQREGLLLRAGHGRLEAMRRLYAEGDLRWAQVAVLLVDWDNSTGTAFAIADNRTSELAEWDKAALERQLRDVEGGNEELQAMFAALAEDLDLIMPDPDDEEPGKALESPPERFQVLITCIDEVHQKALLETFEKEGIECRALVS